MLDNPADARRSAVRRLVIGLVLLLLYALPLFVPPRARPFVAPSDTANLIARIFPYVPVSWVALRLVALFVAAAVIGSAIREPPVRPLRLLANDVAARVNGRIPGRGAQYSALLTAAGHAVSVRWVSKLPPVGQSLYMAWLAVPSLLLVWSGRRPVTGSTSARRRVRATSWVAAAGALIICWLTSRLLISWHSPRTADVVDMWRVFAGLTQMVQKGGNFLVQSVGQELPGVSSVPFFMQGLPLLQMASMSPSLGWVQIVNSLWLAVSAAVVAALAAAVISPSAAPVATAVLLFSPFMLLGPLTTTPLFVGPLFSACPALLLVWFLRTRSMAVLALFGSVAGLAITNPSLSVVTALVLLLAGVLLWRGPRAPLPVVLAALLSFLAASLPSLPGPTTIREMVKLYSGEQGHAAVLEATVFAQLPKASGATAGWLAGKPPGPADVPIATLLSPFAISRTSMRLWGDVLFDPFGAALAAVGLAVCLRHAFRDGTSALLVAFLAATLVTGFISSTDQPSLLRVMGAPVAVALMAAVGFAGIRSLGGTALSRHAPAVAVLAIVIGGMLIFDVVNPRILRASSLGLLVRSLRPGDLDRAAYLNDGRERAFWRFVDEITTQVPRRPIPIAQLEVLISAPDRAPRAELLFWSPAVEQTASITTRVCERWPDAALYTIVDQAHLSRLYAARPTGPGWEPAVPAGQWSVTRCRHAERLALAGHLGCSSIRCGAFRS